MDTNLIPDVVLVEVSFLLDKIIGVSRTVEFYNMILESRMQIVPITEEDLLRVIEIRTQYPQFSFVDSCIMAMAERLNITRVCTFDTRDFRVFRPKHCDYLELAPSL